MTPGRKFSTSTSASAISRRRASFPRSVFRFRVIPFLERLKVAKYVLSPLTFGREFREISPEGDSILMTSAPRSAISAAQKGAATIWPRSSTFNPFRAEPSVSDSYIVKPLYSTNLQGNPAAHIQQKWEAPNPVFLIIYSDDFSEQISGPLLREKNRPF